MPSLASQLFHGSLGNDTPKLIKTLPRNDDLRPHTFGSYDTRLQWASVKGTDNPINNSMMNVAPNGGVRGVMPCKGNPSNGVTGTRVLRKQPVDSSNALTIPQGYAKSQQKGLATLVTKPLNVRPQAPRQFYNPELFNRSVVPGFIPTK